MMWNEKEMKRIFDEPSLTVDEAIAEKYELDYIGIAHLKIEEL